jgi:hypothetical protein
MNQQWINIDQIRGLQRRLGIAKNKSSYPFISGDTYLALCDVVFSEGLSLAKLHKRNASQKIFLPAALKESFIEELQNSKVDFSNQTLVIHNYDNIPNEQQMRLISDRFKKVFSVNWLGDKSIATPIPIGLENWGLQRNGVPSDFRRLINKGLLKTEDRPIQILSSFSIHTNINERSKAKEFSLSFSGVNHMSTFASPLKYRDTVSQSQFVLSPPGNGADCHRTWEAIYLGAIPIVHKSFWPFIHLPLPVLIVDNWFDVPEIIHKSVNTPQMTVEELAEIFLLFEKL